MKQLFNNFKLFKIDDPENDRPFMAACRDQAAKNEERWVLVSLTEKEVKIMYENLRKYFEEGKWK